MIDNNVQYLSMKYLDFQAKINKNVFTLLDVKKMFPKEDVLLISKQLHRFINRGLIGRIKRNLYYLKGKEVDEMYIANQIYKPSYISLEYALNSYGIIPDVPFAVTSVSLTTTKNVKTSMGSFYYSKIKKSLYFGFKNVESFEKDYYMLVAEKEKALLDYFYIRKIKTTAELRLSLEDINKKKYYKFAKYFPKWVQEIKI